MKQKSEIISTDPLGADTPGGDSDDSEIDSEAEIRQLIVETDAHGLRLDHFLVRSMVEFSRSFLQTAVLDGSLTVNGSLVKRPAWKVRVGDVVQLSLKPIASSLAFRPQSIPLDILFEDQHLLVLNKPAGLVVHPAPGNWSGTLLNGLLAYNDSARVLPRAGIVHRLDKDTSGLMVVAKTRIAMDSLVRQIAARAVSRQYLAVAARPWRGAQEFSIEASIGRDPRNRLRMAVVAHGTGKPARTDCRVLDTGPSGTLFHCALHTGRTHQIRVHLASMGMPLAGDSVYARDSARDPITRQALHAYVLGFPHPITGECMRWCCPVPADLAALMDYWALRYNASDASF